MRPNTTPSLISKGCIRYPPGMGRNWHPLGCRVKTVLVFDYPWFYCLERCVFETPYTLSHFPVKQLFRIWKLFCSLCLKIPSSSPSKKIKEKHNIMHKLYSKRFFGSKISLISISKKVLHCVNRCPVLWTLIPISKSCEQMKAVHLVLF